MTTADVVEWEGLSMGARQLVDELRRAQPVAPGWVRCGRSWLSSRLGRTTRQVSRYTAELVRAGWLVKRPGPRELQPDGTWATLDVQQYRLLHRRPRTGPARRRRPTVRVDRPAGSPERLRPGDYGRELARRRRSHRPDTAVSPSPVGDRGSAPQARRSPARAPDRPSVEHAAARARAADPDVRRLHAGTARAALDALRRRRRPAP